MYAHTYIHTYERTKVVLDDVSKGMCNVDGLYASEPIEVPQKHTHARPDNTLTLTLTNEPTFLHRTEKTTHPPI